MLDFMFKLTDTHVFLLMVSITIAFSWVLIIFNKYYIFPKLKYKNNTITASVSSLIGIIYGVLAGFVCLYLINNNDHASRAVLNEGVSAANIYRDSKWLKEPYQHQLQTTLKTYINNVISTEWPQMKKGEHPDKTDGYLITQMSDQLIHYPILSQADNLIVTDLVQEISTLFTARQDRIEMSESHLSPEIWQVLIIGTILLIVINYAFRVNFYLHLFSVTTFSIMAASVLFLLVTLDRPFQGEFVVEPNSLDAVLDLMKRDGVLN